MSESEKSDKKPEKNDELEEKPIEQNEVKEESTTQSEKKYKTDRYGWIKEDKGKLTKKEEKIIEKEEITELRREQKWSKMLSKWAIYTGKKRPKLEERIKKGIPDAFRPKVWALIICPELNDMGDFKFTDLDKYINEGPAKSWTVIEADLKRTLPQCPMFYSERVLNDLRRVLCAYSNRDKELGYTQGMSMIAAMLLLYIEPAIAYECFQTLMLGPRYQRREFFLPTFPRLIKLTKVWEVVFKEKYPKVFNNLKQNNLEPLIYTPSWFLTCYTNVGFEPVVMLRIFDRFLAFGSRALLSFALVIISRLKKKLLTNQMDKLIISIQRPFEQEEFKDWRYLMKKYDKLWIEEKDYERYFKEAGVELFP